MECISKTVKEKRGPVNHRNVCPAAGPGFTRSSQRSACGMNRRRSRRFRQNTGLAGGIVLETKFFLDSLPWLTIQFGIGVDAVRPLRTCWPPLIPTRREPRSLWSLRPERSHRPSSHSGLARVPLPASCLDHSFQDIRGVSDETHNFPMVGAPFTNLSPACPGEPHDLLTAATGVILFLTKTKS